VVRGEKEQRLVCAQYSAEWIAAAEDSMVGFAITTKGKLPINGLRHPPEGSSNGWFLWCGEEFSEAQDFFEPLHTRHIYDEFPEVMKFLGLPSGYRFLLAGDYLDVWYDEKLLHI
jgi:hypothetical protein